MHIDIILRLSKKLILGPLKILPILKLENLTCRCLKIETTNEQKTGKVRFQRYFDEKIREIGFCHKQGENRKP